MDAKLPHFKASAHAFLCLDDLGMFPKLKSVKVLFRKMSGLQKWKSTCATSLGIIRLVQELTSGQHRETIISYPRPTHGRRPMQMTSY